MQMHAFVYFENSFLPYVFHFLAQPRRRTVDEHVVKKMLCVRVILCPKTPCKGRPSLHFRLSFSWNPLLSSTVPSSNKH